jgi:hypothetical protein
VSLWLPAAPRCRERTSRRQSARDLAAARDTAPLRFLRLN